MVQKVLVEIKKSYPYIDYCVVLAYMPDKNMALNNTLYPYGMETVPPKYAISYRNKWMVAQSDFIITFVTHSWGGAAKFKELAEKMHKTVFNLSEYNHLLPNY